MNIPRPEYPRPQFCRAEWLNLNGVWEFVFDDQNVGLANGWHLQPDFPHEILVPYPYQSALSGIGEGDFHDVVWYHRTFSIPEQWHGQNILLNFGAVDYCATVWVNGLQVAYHEGGHTPFFADITYALNDGENHLVLRVVDNSEDLEQPRGKQFWERQSKAIFYTRTTGIWQTVWLEPVAKTYFKRVKFTPNIDAGTVNVEYIVHNGMCYPAQAELAEQTAITNNLEFAIEIAFRGEVLGSAGCSVPDLQVKRNVTITLNDFAAGSGRLWSPENPALYDVKLQLISQGQVVDQVTSYLGMREIGIEDGQIVLNHQPFYMKLLLDQGYFPEGLLTAPKDADLKKDIELGKAMGFNGARKHQKVEDPRYLYWADQLGFVVWGEMANCHTFSDVAVQRITREWQETVERDYNHPSLLVWVPVNESWGVPRIHTDPRQAVHTLSLYYLTKALDPTRLVIANDGWQQTVTDLCSVHDYEGKKEVLLARYQSMEKALEFRPSERDFFTPGYQYQGQPLFISEFGGIAYKKSDQEGWGYTAAANDEDFLRRYYNVVSGLLESPLVQGFCYTQITDVEQEINGLLTYNRQPKVKLELLKAINEGKTWEEVMELS